MSQRESGGYSDFLRFIAAQKKPSQHVLKAGKLDPSSSAALQKAHAISGEKPGLFFDQPAQL